MVYCVGLTGSIASGKSTVAELFSEFGVQIFSADKVSKELTATHQLAFKEIVTHYGTKVLNHKGELDRRALRAIIFSNSAEKAWLEELLHPLIRQKIKELITACTGSYCIVEIPLLIDKKYYPYLNRILLVSAPTEVQISRLMHRDQCTKKEALAILNSQPNEELRRENADDLLINNLGYEELQTAVYQLHQRYLQHP